MNDNFAQKTLGKQVNLRLHVGIWHCFVLDKIEMKKSLYENDIFIENYLKYMT